VGGAARRQPAAAGQAGGSPNLHDRLIVVDGKIVWTLTQSLNAFAARSPASLVRVDPETAALKVAAYEQLWKNAKPL